MQWRWLKRRRLFSLVCGVFLIALCMLSLRDATSANDRGRNGSEVGQVQVFWDRWQVVPAIAQQPAIDGRLDETVWQQAVVVEDFRTVYDWESVSADPSYRIAYDEHYLYIGGSIDAAERESLARIEWLLRHPNNEDAFYTLAIPVREPTRINRTIWTTEDGPERITVTDAQYALFEEEPNGDLSVEAAIPFSSIGGTAGLGSEWGLNIVHVNEIRTKPSYSWAPLLESSYGDSALERGAPASFQAALADQNRYGRLFLGQAPAEPWAPQNAKLEYLEPTEKLLSFDWPEPNWSNVQLTWRSPHGPAQQAELLDVAIQNGHAEVLFRHPLPVQDGLYALHLNVYDADPSDGKFALLTLDREALIAAGESLFTPPPYASTKTVVAAPPSPEVQALLQLIPEQSGVQVAGWPERPGEKPIQSMYTLSEDGTQLLSALNGQPYPNVQFPENHSLTVTSRKGETLTYPYYEDEEGRRYFFSGRLWFEQRMRVVEATATLAEQDPLGAARLLYRFAEVADGYVPVSSMEWNVEPNSALAGPVDRSGIWSPWHVVDLTRGPDQLLQAFMKVQETNAFDLLGDEVEKDVERIIMEELFGPTVDFVLRFPAKQHNVAPYIWQGLVLAGKAIQEPDYVHRTVEWMRRFLETQFVADGFWKEITLSYHNQVRDNINRTLNLLEGYSDPPGYVSPRTGVRFDNLDLRSEFPILQRVQEMASLLAYPDKKLLPLQDTWANSQTNPKPGAGSLLLSSAGVGRLASGQGLQQTQLYMMFTPKYGHNHRDPLNLTLFARGQELLPDLGYSHSKYRQWTASTLAHNTVVVNSRNMDITDASRPGGRTERFEAGGDLFQAMRVDHSDSYAETDEYRREAWFIPFEPGSGEGYVLDLFRVDGGERHEYTLNGDANRDAWIETAMQTEPVGPYLLPPGTEVREPENQSDFGSAGTEYPGYLYVRDVQQAQLDGDAYQLTFVSAQGGVEKAKLRVTGLLESGSNALYLGRSPSLRGTRLQGRALDTNEEAVKYTMPKLVLRRDGEALKSTFATVLEPFTGKEARLEAIERLEADQAPAGAVIVRVAYGSTVDLLLSNPDHPTEPIVVGDVTMLGEMGMIRLIDGVVTEMKLVGGTLLQKGGQSLIGSGTISGVLSEVDRVAGGDSRNALVVDTVISENVAGRHIDVVHPDATTSAFEITGSTVENGKTAFLLSEQDDPGFELLGLQDSQQTYYPGTSWSGSHTFTIAGTSGVTGLTGPVPTGSGTVTGTVYDDLGRPVIGAAVNLTGFGTYAAVTDELGSFVLTSLPAGSHRVTAVKDGFARGVSEPVVVTNGGTGIALVSITDLTPPELSVTPARGVGLGDPLLASSSKTGVLYLVPNGTLPDRSSLNAAVRADGGTVYGSRTPVVAQQSVAVATYGFEPGLYTVYGVDVAGNISAGYSLFLLEKQQQMLDDRDELVTYIGTRFGLTESEAYYNGTRTRSRELGAAIEIPFYGRMAAVIGAIESGAGKAAIYVDGVHVQTVETRGSPSSYQQEIFRTDELDEGVHLIRIEVVEAERYVTFDALRIIGSDEIPPLLLDVTAGPLAVGETVSATSSKTGWLHLVPGSTEATLTAIEAASAANGKKTSVSADVYGVLDTSGLPTGLYRIYATDASGNVSAGSTGIAVLGADMDVIDDRDELVTYIGTRFGLTESEAYYNGTRTRSRELGAAIEIPFYGRMAAVIGAIESGAGKAAIYVDGVHVQTVETRGSPSSYQQEIFRTDELDDGVHLIRIEVAESERYVTFDALLILPVE